MDNASDYESEDSRFESGSILHFCGNETNRQLLDNRSCGAMHLTTKQNNSGSSPATIVELCFGNMGAQKNDSIKS
jgi:hypothetical protein